MVEGGHSTSFSPPHCQYRKTRFLVQPHACVAIFAQTEKHLLPRFASKSPRSTSTLAFYTQSQITIHEYFTSLHVHIIRLHKVHSVSSIYLALSFGKDREHGAMYYCTLCHESGRKATIMTHQKAQHPTTGTILVVPPERPKTSLEHPPNGGSFPQNPLHTLRNRRW